VISIKKYLDGEFWWEVGNLLLLEKQKLKTLVKYF
jgi:hypothetical protein